MEMKYAYEPKSDADKKLDLLRGILFRQAVSLAFENGVIVLSATQLDRIHVHEVLLRQARRLGLKVQCISESGLTFQLPKK